MRSPFTRSNANLILLFLLLPAMCSVAKAQQTGITDYVIFGGNGTAKDATVQRPHQSPGYSVLLGAGSTVTGGSIGTAGTIKTTGTATLWANVYAGGSINLAPGNTITGRIAALNKSASEGKIFAAGSATKIFGNLDINGNSYIASGAVSGRLTHPAGTRYSGPVPAGGEVIKAPALPILPAFPPVTAFAAGNVQPDIIYGKVIAPGNYGTLELKGGQTLRFNGTGIYIFDKIDNGGTANHFVFDFKNDPSGTVKIFVREDADLGKIVVNTANGGSASKIFTEVHGNGSSCANRTWGFTIDNGTSTSDCTSWLGTVWVPFAGINIGAGKGNTKITGALWSGKQVNVQCGAAIKYTPFTECSVPVVNAGPDRSLDFDNQTTLTGSSATPGVKLSWQAINGGIITSGANTAAITVSSAGTYILTATAGGGCCAKDTAIVMGKTNSLIGSELQSIFQNFDPNAPPSPFFKIQHDSVFIDVITKEGRYEEVLSLLQSGTYGLRNILSNGASNYIITGLYPIRKLPLLNALGSMVVYVRPYYAAFNNSGLVTSAGDVAVRSNLVRDGYKLQGEGIRVGVISDSYNTITAATTTPVTNTATQDVGNGDLPGSQNPNGNTLPVHVLQDYPARSADEGRAMLQIVHDLAPKAELYFRTGFISGGDFAAGIGELTQAGCNVIVDDVTFITEPFLKDGVVANAVDAAVAGGATYFSAAGNFSNKSYENSFSPVPAPASVGGTAHNFGGNDIYQNISLTPGDYTIVLQWLDDIYSLGQTSGGGTKNDLDIYLTPNTDGTALFGFNRNNTNGDPIEILPFTVTNAVNTNILITNNTPGSTPARFKYIVFRGNVVINEYNTGASTIVGQANALGAIAVGAAAYDKLAPFAGPPVVESFSSTGGTVVNNVQRNKPELVAPDGVNTTVNLGGDYDRDSYSNFFGTSAAAPHAAAVTALIMEGRRKFLNQPTTSPAQIRTILQTSATNIGTAGFDLGSGYGLINADSAMRTFAQPSPAIVQLVIPDTAAPGSAPFTLTVTGINLSANSVINFRGQPLPTTVINSGAATAVIPAFTGNPPISVYTPPISPSGLDGGYSDTLYFFNIAKKQVIVTADNKSRKYGEQQPELTATILIDSVPIQNTNITLKELGLDSLRFVTLAGANSNVGTYIITPSRIFDPQNPTDMGFLELYNYSFNPGNFTIGRLPVTVVPKDITVSYGQKIPDIQFDYQFDGTNISDSASFADSIRMAHQTQLAKDALGNDILGLVNGRAVSIVNGRAVSIVNGRAVSIVNGRAVSIVNGRAVSIVNAQALTVTGGIVTDTIGSPLTNTQLQHLNFSVSAPALANTRSVTNQTLMNGHYVAAATNIVDVTQESILSFNINSAQTYMLNSITGASPKGLIDIETIANGRAVSIVNGEESTQVIDGQPVIVANGRAVSIVNGRAVSIVNGRAVSIVNGQAVTIVNGAAVPIVNNQNKTAVIIDSSEIGQGASQLKSLNLITGLEAGNQYVIPGSLINDNFETSYQLSTLHILPADLTIRANDTAKLFGSTLTLDPAGFRITSGRLMYTDSILSVSLSSAGTPATAHGGTYPVIVCKAIGTAETDPGNYSITYVNGSLCVSKAQILVKANDTSKVYGDSNPAFTATYSGFNNGETFETSGILGTPAFSTGATTSSAVGGYPIHVAKGTLVSADYSFKFLPGTLIIRKACLQVKAADKVICKGEALPVFTSTISTLKAGDNPSVSYTVSPSCIGAAGVYSIVPALNNFENAKNYNITYINGKLYINPGGPATKSIKPYLDCVEEETPGKYVGHFRCVNENKTVVYVPAGSDNKLSSQGNFDPSGLPLVFLPGTTLYNIPFDGTPLTWQIKSLEGYTKTAAAATASASSPRCEAYVTSRTAGRANSASKPGTSLIAVKNDPAYAKTNIYPNPARDRATLYVADDVIAVNTLTAFDSRGKSLNLPAKQLSANSIELDVSKLAGGMYFVRVKTSSGYKTLTLLRQ